MSLWIKVGLLNLGSLAAISWPRFELEGIIDAVVGAILLFITQTVVRNRRPRAPKGQ